MNARNSNLRNKKPAIPTIRRPEAQSCVVETLEGRQFLSASLDPSFGTGGEVVTGLGSTHDAGVSVALDASGKTYALANSGDQLVVSRYLKNGKLDTTFSGDGKVYLNLGSNENAVGISVTGGKVTVVGDRNNESEIVVARLNLNGTFDQNFNGNGFKVINFVCPTYYGNITAYRSWAAGVEVQSNGQILVAGTAQLNLPGQQSDERFAVARIKTNGALDTSFGSNGIASMEFVPNQAADHQEATCMALQTNGKILVGGRNNYGWGLARFNANGSVDSSFGNGGHATPNFGSSYEYMTAIDVNPSNGRIIAGGFTTVANGTEWALAGLTSAGKLDINFAGNGKEAFTNGNATFTVESVKFQSNGKILALGQSTSNSGDFQIARLNSDGTFDNTFTVTGYMHVGFSSGANDAPAAMALGSGNTVTLLGTTTKNGNGDQAIARLVL